MTTRLKKMTMAIGLALTFFAAKQTIGDCYVAACGDYQVIGGRTVFVCGTNGNSNCYRPCPQK